MTNAFPQFLKEVPDRPFRVYEMESPNPLPAVRCNIDSIWRQTTPVDATANADRSPGQSRMEELSLSGVSGDERREGGAGPLACPPARPPPTVISSSLSRNNGQSPSSEGWDSPGRGAHPGNGTSGDTLLPTIPSPYHPDLSFSGIARHRTDITANYSNYFKINDNKNNMQSVKISIVLDNINNFEDKGIVNDICLISDISLILCVPKLIKNDRYSSVNVDFTEPNRRNDAVIDVIATEAKNLGAFPRFQEKSQNNIKTVDNNCDSIINIKICILINQIFGCMPNDSIPVLKNAITVQGIVYGDPHSPSFNPNLIYYGAAAARLWLNKSDYAFIDTTRIISNRSVFCESETVSRRTLAPTIEAHKPRGSPAIEILNNGIIEFSSNIIKENLSVSTVDRHVCNRVSGKTQNFKSNKGTIEDDPALAAFKNGDLPFAALLKASEQTRILLVRRPQTRTLLRLAGGGESSLNTASGWGSPPNANNNGSNGGSRGSGASGANGGQRQWGSANRWPPDSQPDGNSNKVGAGASGNPGSVAGAAAAGWGAAGAGSSNPPAVPGSGSQPMPPPPGNAGGSGGGSNSPGGSVGPAAPAAPVPSTAKAQLEQLNTMRESLFSLEGWGGQHVNQDTNWDVPTSPEPGVKMDQPGGGPPIWKPSINNGTDLWEANLRNGGQPPPQPAAKTPWGHTPTTNIGGTWGEDDDAPEAGNVWTGPPPQQQWGAPPQQPPHWNQAAKKDDWGGWGEPHRPDAHRPDLHARDMRPAPDHRDMRAAMMMDARGAGDMRGDPRGISGRLNGSEMWGQHHAPHMQAQPKMMPGGVGGVGNGVNQWGAQGPKDMGMAKSSGWEEPSPPAARRNMPNFDDGTSLWGQQRGPWKDMPGMGRGAMQCPPGMPPNRMPGAAPNPMKPDAMWGHPHRNGSWEDGSAHSTNWEKDSANWSEGPGGQAGWAGGPKAKPTGGPAGSWDSDMGDWGGPKPPTGGPPAKLLPKDMVWNSKQFRLLVDMGYKKDDVELALRSRDMNVDEAMDLLSQMRGTGGMDTWRRHEEHPGGPPFEHQPYPAPPRPHHSGFPPQPPSVPFPQPGQGLPALGNITPALVQKILSQPTTQPPPPFNQQNNQSGGSGQPSTAQLRMLVQQIQMAVSAGYLNNQILNQPLAPQTLVLLNQLLQQIKVLQQLAGQHNVVQNSMGVNKANTNAVLHMSVQITKAKQQIANLQNQIAAQQAIYVKQQAGGGGSGGGDFFKPHDPLSQLQNNFTDITLNKDPPSSYGGGGGQQSRLNQWKLPSLDKEGEGSEFSRAPGTTAKPTTSPQLNPLALQPDNTWSTGRPVSDGWPSSDTADLPDGKEPWPSSQAPPTSTYTDLVPEFEPGKPWKMKSIEDDPAITPGSVVRSPLSLAAIKDTDIFGATAAGKASPTTPSERSLSSSTWSYPPPPSTPGSFLPKPGAKASWADAPGPGPGSGSELWGSGKARGPPPGLAASKAASWTQPPRPTSYHQPAWQSTWLLLKNLTAQIDGSTLKTLCMQHGPLQSFHLYLNQGIALAKYSSREEASKAQTALNNCVLGNTTIFAESPADSDVSMILQHLGQGGGGGSAWRGGGGGKEWPFPSLWAEPSEQRATPSLSSFLPPDLLGGESM